MWTLKLVLRAGVEPALSGLEADALPVEQTEQEEETVVSPL